MNSRIEINPKAVLLAMLAMILILLFANVCGIISTFYLDHPYVFGLVRLFNFDREANIPTLYSSLALLFAAMLLAYICVLHKKRQRPLLSWLGLALIFLFLAVDEVASLHEHSGQWFKQFADTTGLLVYVWVIPYGLGVLIFAIVYAKFLLLLPRRISILFIIAGVTFVTGAIGFELLGGKQIALHGNDNIVYAVCYTCEELLEMLGVAIFIYALLLYRAAIS